MNYYDRRDTAQIATVGCFVVAANIVLFLFSVGVIAYAVRWVLRSV